jgi:hypothetical protein
MYEGALILESLKVGTELTGIPLTAQRITRSTVSGVAVGQPEVWSLLEFTVDHQYADALADAFSQALDTPGWYADFHDDRETFVVFPGRVFRYPRGDTDARAEAQSFGRSLGIPEPQLDWTI